MSHRPVELLLEDILEAIGRIEKYLKDASKEEFLEDQMMQDAVLRNITVIGEIVSRLPEEFTDKYPDIPWPRIRGMRNRLVHDYLGIDLEIVWIVTHSDLPPFKEQIKELN